VERVARRQVDPDQVVYYLLLALLAAVMLWVLR
jgi:hypothetical protein